MNASQALTALSLVAGLFVLAGIAAAIVVYIRGTARDIELKRVREDRDDYLSRINYIEPRYEACRNENKLLKDLVDPTKRLDDLEASERVRHDELVDLFKPLRASLERQASQLEQIETRVHVHPEEKS